MDVYAALIAHLRAVDGVAAAYVEAPHDLELKLPAVDLQPVGPARRHRAFNHLGADALDVDVDIYFTTSDALTGAGQALAHRVRQSLAGFRQGLMKSIDVGRPESRPDRNPNIRRLCVTVTVIAPAVS